VGTIEKTSVDGRQGGELKPDVSGSLVTVARIDPDRAYVGVPELLREVIDESSDESWSRICEKIDYIYDNLGYVLGVLGEETDLVETFTREIERGKILLFKPNLVNPECIDPNTHGEALASSSCTEWPLIAALMRWFHDKLDVSYHQMAVGEASALSSMYAAFYNMHLNPSKTITTEAILEGRSGDFYGGWGFYFVRKYLAETHHPTHVDDPMNGYEESVSGIYLPPGKSGDKLMVYDFNRLYDQKGKAKTVPVPEGVNYNEITLPRVIVGGDPGDPEDIADHPGCVLVNVPRIKMHSMDLITNAIKNLGIGLYSQEVSDSDDPENTRWIYSYPFENVPGMKTEVPHEVWFSELDDETGLPLRDVDGNYIVDKTGGMAGTQVDVIKATLNQGVFMVHVVDAIQTVNLNHTGLGGAEKVSEGLIFASVDPVALDLLCARYCLKMVPLKELYEIGKDDFNGEFLQRVPIPYIEGRNIVNDEGYDSPFPRYNLYKYAESRGLGQEKFHVKGWDATQDVPLISWNGHLGWMEGDVYSELITSEFYRNPGTFLWDLQKTINAYLEANDRLTGSSYKEQLYDAFDEDNDGKISYDETGKNGYWHASLRFSAKYFHLLGTEKYGGLRGIFESSEIKYSKKEWNAQGHDFTKDYQLKSWISTAFNMSRMDSEEADPFFPGMTWGRGRWPSLQYVSHLSKMTSVYGSDIPSSVSIYSIYGVAFQYADKTLNQSKYTGDPSLVSDPEAANRYIQAVRHGEEQLDFVVYVPEGFGTLDGESVPNVKEIDDPTKIFTAEFDGGQETWG